MRHGPVAASVEWFRPARRRLDPALQPRQESRAVSLRPRGEYGLFSVILDVGLHVTDNAASLPQFRRWSPRNSRHISRTKFIPARTWSWWRLIFRSLLPPCSARPSGSPIRSKRRIPDERMRCKISSTPLGTDIFSICRAHMAGARSCVGFYRNGWNTLPRVLYAHEATFCARQLVASDITHARIPTFCRSTSFRHRTLAHLSTACVTLLKSDRSTYWTQPCAILSPTRTHS